MGAHGSNTARRRRKQRRTSSANVTSCRHALSVRKSRWCIHTLRTKSATRRAATFKRVGNRLEVYWMWPMHFELALTQSNLSRASISSVVLPSFVAQTAPASGEDWLNTFYLAVSAVGLIHAAPVHLCG